MAIVGILLFSVVFAVSLWAIFATVAPRWDRIVALLNGSAFETNTHVPVAARRSVRRMEPVRFRPQPQRVAA